MKKLPTVGGGGGDTTLPQAPLSRGVDPGGARGGGAGGQVASPQWKYWGANISFLPPPPNNFANLKKFIISNARIGWKSTVIHYKTIKFNIKIIY